jgi:glucosylceramidase
VKIGCEVNHKEVMATAVQNPDGSIVLAVFNPTLEKYNITINLKKQTYTLAIDSKALQTIVLK